VSEQKPQGSQKAVKIPLTSRQVALLQIALADRALLLRRDQYPIRSMDAAKECEALQLFLAEFQPQFQQNPEAKQ